MFKFLTKNHNNSIPRERERERESKLIPRITSFLKKESDKPYFFSSLFFAILFLSLLILKFVFGWNPPTASQPNPAGQTLFADSNNRIGMGTTTPNYFLTISSSTDTLLGLNRVGAVNPVIFKVGTDSALIINASSIDVLTLKQGNVGIGTTGPDTLLTVKGSTANGALKFIAPEGTTRLLLDYTDTIDAQLNLYNEGGSQGTRIGATTNTFFNVNGGNVGIGTVSPGAKLDIVGAGNSPVIRLTSDLATDVTAFLQSVDNLEARFGTNSTHPLAIYTGSTERMRIDTGGNVGIGTTSPQAPLHVAGPDVGAFIYLSSNNGYGKIVLGGSGGSANLINTTGGWQWNTQLNIMNGNVGIGTTAPGNKLQVGASGDGTSAAANAWYTFSDIRLKTSIMPLTDILPKLDNINAVGFNWKNGVDTRRQIGFIAQEVEKVFPELVSADDKGYKSIDYSKFSAILLEAVKEQQKQIEELKSEIKILKEKN